MSRLTTPLHVFFVNCMLKLAPPPAATTVDCLHSEGTAVII